MARACEREREREREVKKRMERNNSTMLINNKRYDAVSKGKFRYIAENI